MQTFRGSLIILAPQAHAPPPPTPHLALGLLLPCEPEGLMPTSPSSSLLTGHISYGLQLWGQASPLSYLYMEI